MTPTILFLVGEPGVGKTTLARGLIGEVQSLVVSPKFTIGSKAVAAGHYTGQPFDGADTIPYSGGRAAVAGWMEMFVRRPLTIFDGDRLSNSKTLEFLGTLIRPPRLLCLQLIASPELCAHRRAMRGTAQSAAWVKGRATKARNFYERFVPPFRYTMTTWQHPDLNLAHASEWLESL